MYVTSDLVKCTGDEREGQLVSREIAFCQNNTFEPIASDEIARSIFGHGRDYDTIARRFGKLSTVGLS